MFATGEQDPASIEAFATARDFEIDHVIDLDRDDLDDYMSIHLQHLFFQASKKHTSNQEEGTYSIQLSELSSEEHQNAT